MKGVFYTDTGSLIMWNKAKMQRGNLYPVYRWTHSCYFNFSNSDEVSREMDWIHSASCRQMCHHCLEMNWGVEVGWVFISYFMNILLTTKIIMATPTEVTHTLCCWCHPLLEKVYLYFASRIQLVLVSWIEVIYTMKINVHCQEGNNSCKVS